jgi:FkbM family methyltransferase
MPFGMASGRWLSLESGSFDGLAATGIGGDQARNHKELRLDYLATLGAGHPYEQKFYLEWVTHRDPKNFGLLDPYFDSLSALSRSSFGLMHASVPGYWTPIFFRGCTSDVLNMRQIFRHLEYGFEFRARPRRILDLGAYCGYAAVFLANRFPNAEIVCVEPSAANFGVLTLNTMPYKNIKRIHGAVWHHPTQLDLVERIGGHWGSIFGEGVGKIGRDESVRAYTVSELLQLAGWSSADYIKCDIEGAELEVFSDPGAAAWLQGVGCVSVETHDRFKPGCTDAIEAALPAARYVHRRSGEFHVYFPNDDPDAAQAEEDGSDAEIILLTPNSLRVRRFDLVNVPPHSWGFQMIDDDTFQLHPNPPGQMRSEVRFHLDLDGQSRFSADCSMTGTSRERVIFSLRIVKDQLTAIDDRAVVMPDQTVHFAVDIPRRTGPCEIILGTEMADGAKTNGQAWARWTRPVLQ